MYNLRTFFVFQETVLTLPPRMKMTIKPSFWLQRRSLVLKRKARSCPGTELLQMCPYHLVTVSLFCSPVTLSGFCYWLTHVLRYDELADSVEDYVLDVLRDQLNRRQPMDNVSRNLLRLLTATCGYKEVRLMAVQRLEMWLQNPKARIRDPASCFVMVFLSPGLSFVRLRMT